MHTSSRYCNNTSYLMEPCVPSILQPEALRSDDGRESVTSTDASAAQLCNDGCESVTSMVAAIA